ncbi:hypothetical protein SKP52_02410 [Sphingopyxis fribergensis]|uniref:Uncharacterized protein n=1 Tax=Sphingopyxis fribergensis TaxID=1515612 RepID=A0A0A7PHJ3_9SPHN|nr:hypothetical protein [Sphingopyxis fribergensis]AJA07417.1 hypothetical protein SKP52_02410 [Sphingopyxis fribergensis]
MIRDIEAAREALADALWWFKGFAAARPASIDEGAGEHLDLERKIGEVRNFLTSVNQASIRRMGEETAVVLTFAEFERLVDAVRIPRLAETQIAIQTIEQVLAEYREEEHAARRGDEIPF